MSLTRDDIQILREVFQPQFDRIDKRFDQMEKKFDEVDKKFDQIDERFEQIDKRFDLIDQRFEKIDKKFDEMKQYIDQRFDQNEASLESTFKYLISDLYELYTPRDEFTGLEKRVTVVEKNPT